MAPNHNHICLYWGFLRRGQGGRAGHRTRLVPWTHQKRTSPWKDSHWHQLDAGRTAAAGPELWGGVPGAWGGREGTMGVGPARLGGAPGRRRTLREGPLGSECWEPHSGDPGLGCSPGTDQRGWLRRLSEAWSLLPRDVHTRVCVCACVCVCVCVCEVWLFATPWTVAHQAPLSMGFSRQEHCSGSPCPPPGDLPDPGIEPGPPALQAGSSQSEPPGAPGRGQRSHVRGTRPLGPDPRLLLQQLWTNTGRWRAVTPAGRGGARARLCLSFSRLQPGLHRRDGRQHRLREEGPALTPDPALPPQPPAHGLQKRSPTRTSFRTAIITAPPASIRDEDKQIRKQTALFQLKEEEDVSEKN